MSVSIQGLDKAAVLAALYNGAKAQGLGLLHYSPKPMTADEAREILSTQGTRFDYLKGRVMKVELSADAVEEYLYDRDNGEGALARTIELLRQESAKADAEEVLQRSANNTAEAAQLLREKLNDPPTMETRGDALIFNPGVSSMASELAPKIDEILGKSE